MPFSRPDLLDRSRSRPRFVARSRGFTLVEILVTVAIIGILAALATPSFVERMRDRRASQIASDVALLYRTAKARALGRGGAQLVRYSTSVNPQGDFTLMEGVQPVPPPSGGSGVNYTPIGNCGNLPLVGSCLAASWNFATQTTNTNNTARIVTTVPERAIANAPIYATFLPPNGAGAASLADICFTPGGRTYVSVGGAPFTVLTAIPTVQVQRYTQPTGGTAIGVLRTVILPPNGGARQIL